MAHLNVEHYRRLLASETDENRRQVLMRLLAEEEAKISGSKINGSKPPDKTGPQR